MIDAPVSPPPGWYQDPAERTQFRWWSGQTWTIHVAAAGAAQIQYENPSLNPSHPSHNPDREQIAYPSAGVSSTQRSEHPGVIGGLIIFVSTLALWVYSACAELFWLGMAGTRIVILMFAAAPTAAAMLYVMCRRLRPMDKITPSFLLVVAILGGFVALIIPALIEPAWGRFTENSPLLTQTLNGPLEEACKLAVVAFAARWVTVRNARTGLFIGGAVGFGYSIFENIDYALRAASGFALSPAGHFGLMLIDVVEREALGAFGHPVWTALASAALFAASGGGRLRITRLVVLAYLGVSVAHSLWDEVPELVDHVLGPIFILSLGSNILLALAGFFVWRDVSIRANRSAFADAATGAGLST